MPNTDNQAAEGPIASELWAHVPVQTGFIAGDTFAIRQVRYSPIDGFAMFEGDIILATVEEMESTEEADTETLQGSGIVGTQYRWNNGLVPYVLHPALAVPNLVIQAIEH